MHAGDAAGAVDGVRAGGVVEHRRDAPHGEHPVQQAHRRGDVRHEHPDGLPFAGQLRHQAPQRQAAFQDAPVAYLFLPDILQDAAAPAENRDGVQQGGEQGGLLMGGKGRFLHDLPQRLRSQLVPRPGARHVRRDDGPGRMDGHGDAREPSPREIARHAAEHGVDCARDVHRHHRGAGPGGHECRSLVDLHHRAGGGHAALGEDQHRPAGLHQPDHRLHRQRVRRVHDQVRQEPHGQANEPVPRNGRVQHPNRVNREEGPQQNAIQKGLMVGNNHKSVVRGDGASHPDAEEQPQQPADQQTDHRPFSYYTRPRYLPRPAWSNCAPSAARPPRVF